MSRSAPLFSPEQQEVIETWNQGMAVLAGAGSGKTTTLVGKCARLIEKDPQARFAAVSFTERSASDLRSKLSDRLMPLSAPGSFHQHWIMTIHGLCAALIRENPKEAGLEGEEAILPEAEAALLWERAIESLWIEDLPKEILASLEKLLDRESRQSLSSLLKRMRDLAPFGALQYLASSEVESSQDLNRVASMVLERYQRLKWRRGGVDFSDLEIAADRALESPQVRAIYHERFKLVLVDEFQDTNPLQARIIWKLVRPDLSNLCVVGDPKQSIYRFRDADVGVFEQCCSQLPVRLVLTWNFRSRPGIIEFSNQICEKAFSASEMTFDPLIPKREPRPELEPLLRLDIQEPSQLGEWIQSEIQKGIALHEMVLLVRKIRGNEKWFRALSGSGIPIAIGSGGLFWEDPRVREMVSFLKWWNNPGNSLSGAIFLRAPWVGISDLILDQWVREDSTLRKPFFSSSHPLSLRLRSYVGRRVRPGELLLALLVNDAVEDELAAPLLGLWHRAEEWSSQGLDFHQIVVEMSLSMSESRREREVPAPKNLGQLSVLTLHGAKGLEFPHVILIDFGPKPRASDMPLLFWDRKKGVYFAGRTADGERDKANTQEVFWRDLEKKKNLEESKRLFYVALTRARERLVLVCPELKLSASKSKEGDAPLVFREENWRGWIDEFTEPSPFLSSKTPSMRRESTVHDARSESSSVSVVAISAPKETKKKAPPRLIRARHSVTEWTLLARCPRAYEWTFIRPVLGEASESAENNETEDKRIEEKRNEGRKASSELGTRVHALLESGDWKGLQALEQEVGSEEFASEPVLRWSRNSEWMKPAEDQEGRKVWTELNFEVPLGNEILVGSIDRLVQQKRENEQECSFTLLDFKVTEKLKSRAALIETYQTQMQLYAWALTALDPRIRVEELQAVLVNISTKGVQTVSIDAQNLNLPALLELSQRIVSGEAGEPRPGPRCEYCGFKAKCPEAATLEE